MAKNKIVQIMRMFVNNSCAERRRQSIKKSSGSKYQHRRRTCVWKTMILQCINGNGTWAASLKRWFDDIWPTNGMEDRERPWLTMTASKPSTPTKNSTLMSEAKLMLTSKLKHKSGRRRWFIHSMVRKYLSGFRNDDQENKSDQH